MDMLTGRLSEIGLSVLLDELEVTYSTGNLKLFKEEKTATAIVYKGHIVKCKYNNLTDTEAFLAMIILRFETYSFIHNESVQEQPSIIDNIEKLFISGYQMIDEVNHMTRQNGRYICKSNGYVPDNDFQKSVCAYIKKPVALDNVVSQFISKIHETIGFIKNLNTSNNIVWSNQPSLFENETRSIVDSV